MDIRPIHVVLIAVTLLAALWFTGILSFNPEQVTIPTPEDDSGLVTVNKPLKFSLSDPLGGSAIASANVYIYGTDKVLKESLTTASDGTVTSALPYQSGDTINVKVAKSGYVTRWFSITVPKMSPADAQSLTSNFIALQTYNLGTYTLKVTDQFGNTYSDGGTMNFTTLGASTVSVTVTLYNTEDNSGYISSFDKLNDISLNAAMVTSTAGSKATVSGAGSSVTRGTTSYWINVVSDDGLTRQLVGNQYVKPGVTSVTLTFGKGSLAAGDTEAYTFTLYDYFDQSYFASNGIGGPDAASLTSLTLNLAA